MLAIVIPYYKKTYFRETMESIASQACKGFTLYIGDDASPESPIDIIDDYKDRIRIVYHRFEENLGSIDLVAQWERCIDLTNGEEWLWLFSDDDMMDEGCVKEYYESLEQDNNTKIIRFSKKHIDENNSVVYATTYKKGLTLFSEFLLDGLDLTENHITMPEFLFSRLLYKKYGFYNLPLAWGSDKATYLEYVYHTGAVYNLECPIIYRMSTCNISSAWDDFTKKIKYNADVKFRRNFVCTLLFKASFKYKKSCICKISDWFVEKCLYEFRAYPKNIIERLCFIVKAFWFSYSLTSKKNLIKILINK